jgi:hypothetical protein
MGKIYAIGDIHGDYDKLCQLLLKHNLINSEKDWIGGNSTFICIGDLMDRGIKGIDVLNLFIKLESQSNGNVVSLMGNHDAIMIATASIQNKEWYNRDCVSCFYANGGNFEELEVIANNELLLNWLKNRPLMHKQNNILFQHADSAKYYLSLGRTVEEINNKASEMLNTGEGAWNIFAEMTDCRFWDRPYLIDDNALGHIEQYLSVFDVDTVIHGHTREISNAPIWYYNGKICNLDGSMSIGYRNDPDRGFIVVFDEEGNVCE